MEVDRHGRLRVRDVFPGIKQTNYVLLLPLMFQIGNELAAVKEMVL